MGINFFVLCSSLLGCIDKSYRYCEEMTWQHLDTFIAPSHRQVWTAIDTCPTIWPLISPIAGPPQPYLPQQSTGIAVYSENEWLHPLSTHGWLGLRAGIHFWSPDDQMVWYSYSEGSSSYHKFGSVERQREPQDREVGGGVISLWSFMDLVQSNHHHASTTTVHWLGFDQRWTDGRIDMTWLWVVVPTCTAI